MLDNIYHFIVLVPHRDALLELKKYTARNLISHNNIPFPNIAPIAITSEPVQSVHLKTLAKKLRSMTLCNSGKINCGDVVSENIFGVSFNHRYSITGRKLLLDTNELLNNFDDAKNIKYKFTNVVICLYITHLNIANRPDTSKKERTLDCISSCALANMAVRIIDGDSFEWKIGRLFWLERYRATVKQGLIE